MHLNSLFNKCRRTVILIPTKLCQDEQNKKSTAVLPRSRTDFVSMNFTRWDWQLVVGKSHLLFLGADRVGGGGGEEAIGHGWRCLSYLSGVKISDLVPFTVSKTVGDYQRPSWYLLGCFSLNKIPEIRRTILMIWLETLEHIDKGVLIFGIYQFFCV